MSFQEKTLQCADCGTDFSFTAEEQEFFGPEVVVTATGSHARCFPPYAPSAAKRPKCLLSPPMAGQSIVAIATVK